MKPGAFKLWVTTEFQLMTPGGIEPRSPEYSPTSPIQYPPPVFFGTANFPGCSVLFWVEYSDCGTWSAVRFAARRLDVAVQVAFER